MKKINIFLLIILFTESCTFKKQLVYLNDSNKTDFIKNVNDEVTGNVIEPGDILSIDVQTSIPEAAIPYNEISDKKFALQNIELLKLQGYLVDKQLMINFPVLGKIKVGGLNEFELESVITDLLIKGSHLSNPTVKIRKINSKFTILGEVRNPGTFSYFERKLNILQAIGYAGDLTIDAKRKDISLIREQAEGKKIYKVDLTDINLLDQPYYNIKNNDVIIINPSFSKIKSAGFIGSPSSVASIASLLLSITLLITNN